MLKKPATLFISSGGVQSLQSWSYTVQTCRRSAFQCSTSRQSDPISTRGFATVKDDYDGQASRFRWPKTKSPEAIPTPYEIFNQKKGTPYSKHRFYELVKIYHPDRHSLNDPSGDISPAVKLERYRLIVAANEILSDPVKRSAYDSYGAGWNGMPEVRGRRNRDTDGSWHGPNSPSGNATWEDWERWREQNAGGKQAPVYVSNHAFVMVIAAVAAAGLYGQRVRMDNFSSDLVEKVEARHIETSKQLMRTRQLALQEHGDGDMRRHHQIERFLRIRDATNHGIWSSQEEGRQPQIPGPVSRDGNSHN